MRIRFVVDERVKPISAFRGKKSPVVVRKQAHLLSVMSTLIVSRFVTVMNTSGSATEEELSTLTICALE